MAALKLPFDVTPDGRDTFRVVATSRDVSTWERTGKRARSLGDGSGNVSQLEEICHIACQRQELWQGSLAEFRASCDIDPLPDDDDTDDDEDEDRPTRPAR